MEKDDQKKKRIKSFMEKYDMDLIISRYTENVLYFTNVWPITGWGLAFIFREGKDTVLYLPESEMDFTNRAIIEDIRPYVPTNLEKIKSIIEGMDIKKMKVGLELTKEGLASSHLGYEVAFPNTPTFNLIKKTLPDCEFMDATPIIEEMRACKTDFELKQLQLVNDVNYYGLLAASEFLHVDGFTEMEIATECEKTIMDRIRDYQNIDFIRAYAFVMAGENGINASRPFNISTAKKCKRGEFVMLELNTQINGYWSDLTRTWVCGRSPTDEQKDQADAVISAINDALSVMKPGGSWLEAYERSRQCIVEKGYGEYHTPFLGHGIGVKLHEPIPMMHNKIDKDKVFEQGHYCSVEPGLYFKKIGALRIERDVAVTEKGPVIFDEFPCGL
ncbi:MAG: M24 family metallopeptidase [Promethearchaeota archaeon]